jgi:hypothetical protein
MIVALAIVAWFIFRTLAGPAKEVRGDVELGIPTVTGSSVVPDSDIYYSKRGPSLELDPGNPAIDSRMRELIFESNARIRADEEEDES